MIAPTTGGSEAVALGQPATLTVVNGVLAVGDWSGNILFRRWPDGPIAVVEAHGDAGPMAPAGSLLVTAGGWDPNVRAWDPADAVPEWSAQPVDGVVTAVCGTQGRILAAGADRDHSATPPAGGHEDRVRLEPAGVFELEGRAPAPRRVADATGAISGLACGDGWFAFVDQGAAGALVVVQGGDQILGSGPFTGPVQAVVAGAAGPVTATTAGIWRHDVAMRTAHRIGAFTADALTVLGLALVGDSVIAATSEGLRRWPGDHPYGPQGSQPVAITTVGDTLLVLWSGGRIEQRDESGALLAEEVVPHRL